MTRDPLTRHRLCALSFVLLFALVALFAGLGMGPFEVYDEGLYGMYAQNALHHGAWLHAVDTHGVFPSGATRYSKPPLVLWLVAGSFKLLGPSLFALRLPFALASLASALLLFVWGQRFARGPSGIWLGTLWASAFVASHGVYHYGRTATIEPVLIVFVLMALFSGARAATSYGSRAFSWSSLAGLAVSLAFLTKQVVCVLALGPLVLAYLLESRRAPVHTTLTRLLPTLLLPLLTAGAWVFAVMRRAGKGALEALWEHGVTARVGGFNGVHHRNYLNRVADQLGKDAPPLVWELGVVGLLLLALSRRRDDDGYWDGWLMAFLFGSAWLAFDVGSRAILPWYVLTLLPGIALGSAFLLHQGACALTSPVPTEPLSFVTRAAGIVSLVMVLSTGTRGAVSGILSLFVGTLVTFWLMSQGPRTKRQVTAALGLGAALVLTCVLGRDGHRYGEPTALSTLGTALHAHGAHHVSLDDKTHTYERTTFLGTLTEVTRAPWQLAKTRAASFDARVEHTTLPRELRARAGLTLLRAPGMFAVKGDLTQAPFAEHALERLLERGPLTFEAEDLTSERYTTLTRDERGHAGRGYTPWLLEPARKFWLARGSTPELPRGSYEARFRVDLSCSGRPRKERLGSLHVKSAAGFSPAAERALVCQPDDDAKVKEAAATTLPFRLTRAARVELGVRYENGDMALDCIEVRRTGD